jgi:hypothetical protein
LNEGTRNGEAWLGFWKTLKELEKEVENLRRFSMGKHNYFNGQLKNLEDQSLVLGGRVYP